MHAVLLAAGARDPRGDRAAGAPARSRRGGCCRPRSATTSSAAYYRPLAADSTATLAADARASSRTRAPGCSPARASPRRPVPRRARADMRYVGQEYTRHGPARRADDLARELRRRSRTFHDAHLTRYGQPTRARRSSSSTSASAASAALGGAAAPIAPPDGASRRARAAGVVFAGEPHDDRRSCTAPSSPPGAVSRAGDRDRGATATTVVPPGCDVAHRRPSATW